MSKRIRVDVKNFNKHTPEGMELLEKSISEVGAIESVTVDAEGEIITGNARKETFYKLGYKPKFIELKENEYPVIQTDLSGEKRVKAERQVKNGGRLHHHIKSRYLYPKLLRGNGRDNIAWDTYPEDVPFTNEPKRTWLK